MDTLTISNSNLTPEERLLQVLKIELVQEGADPSRLLTSLAAVIESKAWLALGLSDFIDFVIHPEGLHAHPDDIAMLVSLHHRDEAHDQPTAERMRWLRQTVRDELTPVLAENGDIGRGRNRRYIMTPNRGTGESYTIRRLKRDRPDLAIKVINGSMKAHAAAIEAGFGHKTTSVRTDDPANVAAFLAKHFDAETIKAIAEQAVQRLKRESAA